MMNVIYMSDEYYVVEYPIEYGYEIVNKRTQRSGYIQGDVANRFAEELQHHLELLKGMDETPTTETVDEFLDKFEVQLSQALVIH